MLSPIGCGLCALAALRRALALDPGHPILLGQLGVSLSYQKRYDEAVALITQARAEAPAEGFLLGQHAYLMARLKRGAAARALLDTAAAHDADRIGLATTYALLGDSERAINLVQAAVRESRPGSGCSSRGGYSHRGQGRPADKAAARGYLEA